MSITHQVEGNYFIIKSIGDMTIGGINLKSYLEPYVDDPTVHGIAIDFTQVNFIDSSGVWVLFTFWKTLKGRKVALSLFNLNDGVRRAFYLTGLEKTLHICSTKREALKYLREQGQ